MISNNYHQHPAYPHLLNSFHRTKTHLIIANLNIFCLFENPEILSAFLRKTTKKLQTTKKLKSLTFNFKGVQLARESIKVIDKDLFKGLYDLENLKIVLCPIRLIRINTLESSLRLSRASDVPKNLN